MKKIIVLFLTIAMFLSVLTGCSFYPLDNNFPASMEPEYNRVVSEAMEIVSDYKFGDSLSTEASMVAYTIDKDYTFDVVMLYRYGEGSLVSVPIVERTRVELMDHYQYREFYRSQFIIAFPKALEKYELPTDGEIVGTVINWSEEREYSFNWHSICDSDGDAKWDYLSDAEGKFSTDYVQSDDEKLTMTAKFVTDGQCQDLEGCEKTPTFKDLDKKL